MACDESRRPREGFFGFLSGGYLLPSLHSGPCAVGSAGHPEGLWWVSLEQSLGSGVCVVSEELISFQPFYAFCSLAYPRPKLLTKLFFFFFFL